MAQAVFVPGQRWISHGESELGLGLVTETTGRQVELFFPAAEAHRTYATQDAPLSRYQLEPGATLTCNAGIQHQVVSVEHYDGLLRYQVGSNGSDDNPEWIDELELDPFVELNRPQDRFFAAQIDSPKAFELRRQARKLQHRLHSSESYGLLGPRVQLLPHQFYIASQVARRHSPRVLLADEVGLGKTIEAGLIIHQQIISGRSERVMVVVPDSLVHQWLVEMLRRFNLFFRIMNREQYQALTEVDTGSGLDVDDLPLEIEEPGNPFESAQLFICPQSLLTDLPGYFDAALACSWDLLVVDEAHHLQWSEQQVSPEYQCIEQLAAKSSGLLLLTATPEQLGLEGHFARLRLIDRSRYFDLNQFREQESQYQPLRELIEQLLECDDLLTQIRDEACKDRLLGLLDPAKYQSLLQQLEQGTEVEACRTELVDLLLDQHGTGRVLFRNTRDQVQGFPGRALQPHLLDSPFTEQQSAETELAQQLRPELMLGEDWCQLDPRVEWLKGWLEQHKEEKVLLICAERETAQQLEDYLRLRVGIRSAVFHEQLSLVNRDRAAAYFAEPEEGAQLLVCSEIGSEGRNFQFASHLIMFDLPLNPDLVEQRIGRLDRIGQRSQVQIHLPLYRHSPAHHLMRWLHEGLDAFLSPCPFGQLLLEQQQATLEDCLLEQNEQDFDDFIEQTRAQADQLRQQQQQGRDRLLELNSCRPQQAQQVIDQLQQDADEQALRKLLERSFDYFGVELQPDTTHSVLVRPGDHMRCGNFPGLPEQGLHGTFDRQQALEREDMAYLSWEHPVARGALELVCESDTGNTAIATLKLPGIKAGSLLLECLFVLDCQAPRSLQLARYLPSGGYRVLLTAEGRECANLLSEEQLAKLAKKLPKQAAKNMVKPLREPLTALLKQAESLAEAQLPGMIEQAQQQMLALQQPRLERLQMLAKVNPAIRDEEIAMQQQQIDQLQQALERSMLKLDGIQVLITT
ncbi:RNA polymerase-associated protein RapA [Motiliproteus coralliicola]|uniref:RNA polymerase-associated protein RapA n=1 Tax=Motiliproteus coralliicola TaxID=2283196 RepID=A0A369WTX1_9GAMM|nr:RNA polymerase-associated protein RapA [Motiliproteus coralliicola]RDE24583.1 RNA polymerase-associated protein RapA [Motiliproteus coralliicola]